VLLNKGLFMKVKHWILCKVFSLLVLFLQQTHKTWRIIFFFFQEKFNFRVRQRNEIKEKRK
jgi:hypothetical protein